ncbi:MAG: iron-containing alcohol dehydrogenase [Polyangiaceae bacterium]|nr:iron-containing alcohol dehydrogenase [Polyangiaceae bacterium]
MLSKTSFDLVPSTRASFGVGAIAKLGKRLLAAGHRAVTIVTDEGLVAPGVAGRVEAVLRAAGIASTTFSGVAANPTGAVVLAGAEHARASRASALVALGGGSPMDAAKAIALMAPNEGELADFAFGCRPAQAPLAVYAVPTTAGTGSETNMFAVITDETRGRKMLIAHSGVLPAAALLDPELGVGAPRGVTAACGLDALTHALEALASQRGNPFSEALALQAITLVGRHLEPACADGAELEGRSGMLLASHLAGLAFNASGLGLCHAMGHPLSARLGVPHGQALASLLPQVMRYAAPVVGDLWARAGAALGVRGGGSEATIREVERLREAVGAALPLRALGVTSEGLPTLVEDALADPLMIGTPRPAGAVEVRRLYEEAM